MEKFAAIDFETANWQQTSVCSVGIVVMNRGVIEDRFYSLIHPAPNFYSRRNTAIHGLSREDTEEALAFPTVWREIAPMIEGIPLVAHNSMFDEGCLKAVFRLYEMDYPGYSFYCTYRLSRKLFKGLENYQLHTVSSFCGYDLKNHHHALADAGHDDDFSGHIRKPNRTLVPAPMVFRHKTLHLTTELTGKENTSGNLQ